MRFATCFALVLAVAATAPAAARADEPARGEATVGVAVGAITNLDGDDEDGGTGMTPRFHLGYRFPSGLEPMVFALPIGPMPAHDGGGTAWGLGLRFGRSLGPVEPFAELGVSLIDADPGNQALHMVGVGIGADIAPRWRVNGVGELLHTFDSGTSGQPILFTGVELVWQL